MSATLRQYFDLTKPRVVALIVFTALVGMLLAIDGLPTLEEARRGLLGFLGIWLAASSAAAINQLLDARIDATTRNALVRARIERAAEAPAPGASVRVRVPVGPSRKAVAVPASALRKGPGGDHVFAVAMGDDGKTRAYVRQVQSGAMLDDVVIIDAGLSAGERVAASGSFKLRDAALVAITGEQADKRGQSEAITRR